jgi:hypothetical protein
MRHYYPTRLNDVRNAKKENPAGFMGYSYNDEWIGMRHHHTTRLSDVPKEDERS